jgi:signal transduction histidine kinase
MTDQPMDANTIVLVDDEEGIRKVLGISLQDLGYRIFVAADGAEGLEMCRQVRPAIVLTDIKMPVMDGIELLKQIKTEMPDTEVIMITGHGELNLAIDSLKFDATDFISKPINDQILAMALKRAGERFALRRQLRAHTENLEQLVAEKTGRLIEAERLAAVGETVAGLAHTIKNIAGSLKGGAFVLEKGIELNDKAFLGQGWEMIKGNVEKITRLSLDLLGYGKAARIHRRLCDPNLPAREVIELVKPHARVMGIALDIDLSAELTPILLDPEGIHRCLHNLAANAMDAVVEGPADSRRMAIISDKPEGWGVRYRVTDAGAGMSADVKAKIFQAFFTTKGTRGTGIGLMITRKIVNAHQGTIEVESQPGAGTTVAIKLPEK